MIHPAHTMIAGGARRRAAAFTLVEVLVASTVFLLLTVLFTQLVTNTSALVIRGNNTMDSVADTRQALGRFMLDWAGRVRRADVDWVINNPGTASTDPASSPPNLVILSQVTALDGTRGIASVAYRINPATFGLERGTAGYGWTKGTGGTAASPAPLLVFPGASASFVPTIPPDTNYETVAPTVFRLCLSYLDTSTGKWTVLKPNSNLNPGETWISLNSPNFGALAVTIASLDTTDRVIVNPGQIQSLSNALGDMPNAQFPNLQDPLAVWTQELDAPGFAAKASVPARVAGAVRIYQRIFYAQ